MARLTVRKVVATHPEELWKRFEGGAVTGWWIAPAGGSRRGPPEPSSAGARWRERLRIGPISFSVFGTWAERHPPERSLCLLDSPWGLRIAEELRLERIAAGTQVSLTMDYSLGDGGMGEWLGDWLDRVWFSRWVSRRLHRGLLTLQQEYQEYRGPGGRAEGEVVGSMVHFERPEDRPWGLDQRGSGGRRP
ncbi:MAG: hypothetical protein HYY21_09350 [Candidatus Tectomicrobia bacterium]|nr:hypothetical protein [Candidatus Tectomicrobia bacterium]